MLDLLASWADGQSVRELAFQPDLAVAKGASFYGRNRVTGKGMRIKAGAARSYYIGLETSMPAVPGFKPPKRFASCRRDGGRLGIADRRPGVRADHRAARRVPFLLVRGAAAMGGTNSADAERELEETSLLEINLPVESFPAGQGVPVQINPIVTELGNLELWMKHTNSDRRWKVEFQVRTE